MQSRKWSVWLASGTVSRSALGVFLLVLGLLLTLSPDLGGVVLFGNRVPPPLPAVPASTEHLVVRSGDGQTAASGAALPSALVVEVVDDTFLPLAGVTVTFSVAAGGGRLASTTVVSNAGGLASVAYTLGPLHGTNTIRATAGGTAVEFSETAVLALAQHTDYHVSALASGAADGNDGLSATLVSGTRGPWKTVTHAAGVAGAGDIVHIHRGTYRESIYLTRGGTAGSPLRFVEAAIGDDPVLTSFHMHGVSYVEVRGLTVVGPKVLPARWVDMPAVLVDSPATVIQQNVAWTSGRQAAVDVKYASFVGAVSAFTTPFTAGLWASASHFVTFSDDTVSLHTAGIDVDTGSTNVTVSNNTMFHCYNGFFSYAVSGPSFSSSVVQDNQSRQNLNAGVCICSGATLNTIAHNRSQYNALHNYIVSGASSHNTLLQNSGQNAGYYTETMPFPGSSSFNFAGVGPGNVADGNSALFQQDVTGNDGNGFIVDTSSYGVKFVNNVAYMNQGSGICLTHTSVNTVVNNTLVSNGLTNQNTGNGAGVRIGTTSTGNTIENNVLSGNRVCGIQSSGVLSQQTSVDHNLYSTGVAAIRDSYSSAGFYATAAAVFAATGKEPHGLSGDPAFAGTGDFHLGAGSPAIGKGNLGVAPTLDHDSAARSGAPDIGAYEFH